MGVFFGGGFDWRFPGANHGPTHRHHRFCHNLIFMSDTSRPLTAELLREFNDNQAPPCGMEHVFSKALDPSEGSGTEVASLGSMCGSALGVFDDRSMHSAVASLLDLIGQPFDEVDPEAVLLLSDLFSGLSEGGGEDEDRATREVIDLCGSSSDSESASDAGSCPVVQVSSANVIPPKTLKRSLAPAPAAFLAKVRKLSRGRAPKSSQRGDSSLRAVWTQPDDEWGC